MGGFVTVAVYLIVIVVSFMGGNLGLGWLGIGLGVASLWTWGVAHNFAVEADPQAIPNWLAALHLALTVLGIVLLIVVFVVR